MFSTARKQAQARAQQLLSGHCTLIAWWTLRHAGVLEAMVAMEEESSAGIEPLVYAMRTNMSAEVLQALLDYLATAGLITVKKGGARLTAEGRALLDHEDGTLGYVKAYQPVLELAEHLLAKLKSYAPAVAPTGAGNGAGGISRKIDYLTDASAKRYASAVFPEISHVIAERKLTHLLDLSAGSGDLLIQCARESKHIVGVGVGADGIAVRRANQVIERAELTKRLIAITANPFDVCLDTQRTFDRIGLSRQLWKELDCVIALNLFSEFTGRPADITRVLAAIPKSFPNCTLCLIEPVASERADRPIHTPEIALLHRLARSSPLSLEAWRAMLADARLRLAEEVQLSLDGLILFRCKPAHK